MTAQILPSKIFEAPWTQHTLPYKSRLDTPWKKVAWNIISIVIPIIGLVRLMNHLVTRIVKSFVVPGALTPSSLRAHLRAQFHHFWFSENSPNPYREIFIPEKISLKTADKVKLSSCYFRHKDSNEDTPAILVCQPNAGSYYSSNWNWVFQEIDRMEAPCDVYFFDYRGFGDSEGSPENGGDLIKDVSAAREYLRSLGKDVKIFGHSLGGGVGGMIPDAEAHVFDRTFSTISNVGINLCSPMASTVQWAIKKTNFEIDLHDAILRSPSRKMILFHPHDEIMRGLASAHRNAPNVPVSICELQERSGVHYNHGEALNRFAVEGKLASRKALQFLLNQVQPAQRAVT